VAIEAAPVAVDPPGCVYERSVRKLPGGGLQRVIVKICPDA
jgi:translation initiation factor RLI1